MYMVTYLISTGKRAFYLLTKRGNQVVSYIANHYRIFSINIPLKRIHLRRRILAGAVGALRNTIWETQLKFHASSRHFGSFYSSHTIQLHLLWQSRRRDWKAANAAKRIRYVLSQVFSGLIESVLAHWVTEMTEEKRNHFMHWIWTIDFENEHAITFEKRYMNTGNWLLRKPNFKQWFDATNYCVLWCYGKRKNVYIILLNCC